MSFKQIYTLMNCFSLFQKVTSNSRNPTIKELALMEFKRNLESDTNLNKIVLRMFPDLFSIESSAENPGFNFLLLENASAGEEIDLSGLDIDKIPLSLCSKMKSVIKLNLSGNKKLKFDRDWVGMFETNLKELILNDCLLTENDLEAISHLNALEKLKISGKDCLNADSSHFVTILMKLKHLDASNCFFDDHALKQIYKYGEKLEFLDFSSNNLSTFFTKEEPNDPSFKETIKVLKLSNCDLRACDLKRLLIFNSLEDIDLSRNNFSEIDQITVEKIFPDKQPNNPRISFHQIALAPLNVEFKGQELNNESHCQNLKIINLIDCKLNCPELISRILDLEKLEVLKISRNNVQLTSKHVLNRQTCKNLKAIEMNQCNIRDIELLKVIMNLPKLEKLDLGNTSITEENRNAFENIPNDFTLGCSKNILNELRINNTLMNLDGFKAVTDCLKLETLDVSGNNFSNISKDFKLGGSRESLKKLNVSSCYLNSFGFEIFTDLPKLEQLNISGNNLSDTKKEFKLGCSQHTLKELNASNSLINLYGFNAIAYCYNVEVLDVSDNVFSCLSEKFNFRFLTTKLKKLKFCGIRTNSNGLKSIAQCNQLESLDLTGSGLDINDPSIKNIASGLNKHLKEFIIE